MSFENKFEKQEAFKKKKLLLGIIYGLTCGCSFAVFAWGIDAILLANANAAYYWIKFVPGLLMGGITAATAGWLTILFEKHSIAFVIWGIVAIIFTLLALWLPTSGTELLIQLFNPDLAHWLNFPNIDGFIQFLIVGWITIGLAAIIGGILEINLVEQVLFSAHSSSIVTMIITCLVIFGLAGSATDHLINVNFREPIQALDRMLKTAEEYADVTIPQDIAREQHLSAINHLGLDLNNPRKLTLISFDRTLGNMNVLVDLKETWIQCAMIYSQAANCSAISDVSREEY
jgi:hypothetical protein